MPSLLVSLTCWLHNPDFDLADKHFFQILILMFHYLHLNNNNNNIHFINNDNDTTINSKRLF